MEPIQTEKQKLNIWSQARLVNLTDGVFAFAMTLLVLNLIDLRIPAATESLGPLFAKNAPIFISFVITFIIIARFWVAHTHLFAAIKEADRTIVNLNIVLLFLITVFPFFALVFGTHIHSRDAVILYASCFALIGFIQYLIGRHAFKSHLFIGADMNPYFLKIFTYFSLSTPMVFVVSIALVFISPYLAEGLWVLLFVIRSAFRFFFRNNTAAEIEMDKL